MGNAADGVGGGAAANAKGDKKQDAESSHEPAWRGLAGEREGAAAVTAASFSCLGIVATNPILYRSRSFPTNIRRFEAWLRRVPTRCAGGRTTRSSLVRDEAIECRSPETLTMRLPGRYFDIYTDNMAVRA